MAKTEKDQDERDPQADARISKTEVSSSARARASGRGAAAAASGGGPAIAAGSTTAAAGESSASAEGVERHELELQRDLDLLTGVLRESILACLQAAERRQIQVDQIKETVDDLWAEHAAKAVRIGSPLEQAAKELLVGALKLGPTFLGKLLLPKVP